VTLQDREIIDILRRLERLSWGSTTAWNASTARGKPGSRALTFGHDLPPHEHYRREYERKKTDAGRDIVITDARRELYTWMKRPGGIKYREPAWNTVADEIRKEGRGDLPEVVALAKRVTPSMVRKARNEEGLNPETGLEMAPLSGCEMPAEERRATVIQMVGKGLSAKAVALRLGVHYNTVRRDLARAD
jgi:hypothetical protein